MIYSHGMYASADIAVSSLPKMSFTVFFYSFLPFAVGTPVYVRLEHPQLGWYCSAVRMQFEAGEDNVKEGVS